MSPLKLSVVGEKAGGTPVKPVEADRITIAHEVKNGETDAEATITDEDTISEIVMMHNTLKIYQLSRPMDEDRFVITFYLDDEVVAVQGGASKTWEVWKKLRGNLLQLPF